MRLGITTKGKRRIVRMTDEQYAEAEKAGTVKAVGRGAYAHRMMTPSDDAPPVETKAPAKASTKKSSTSKKKTATTD